MSLIRVNGRGQLDNVSVGLDSTDYGIEVLGAGVLNDVTIFGEHTTAQIAFIGNGARAKNIRCAGDGDGIVISGNSCKVEADTESLTDLAAEVSGADNRLNLFADTPVLDALLLSGLWNDVKIHAISPGDDGINITGDHNQVTGAIRQPGKHGCIISGDANRTDLDIDQPGGDADDTYDGFAVEGSAERNRLKGKVTPRPTGNATRHGVFLDTGTSDNHVTDVDLGVAADYGTGEYVDNGTNFNAHEGDATYGDNWAQ
jgi:hypothetical protein